MTDRIDFKSKKVTINNKKENVYKIHGDKKIKHKLCATLHPLTINDVIDGHEHVYNNNKKIIESIKRSTLNEKKIKIPVAFHVIYPNKEKNNNKINILDSIIDKQIDALNGSYEPSDPNFTKSYGYNLSQPGHLTEGNKLSGIFFYNYNKKGGAYSRTNNSKWFYKTEENESEMKKKLNVGDISVVNIYISDANGYLGWAYFPYDFPEESHMHGIVISYTTLPESDDLYYCYGRTLIHELGHYLGLYHTFQDGCKNNDGCDDTPAQNDGDNIYSCEKVNTCNGKGMDPINNYMNYTDDLCLTHFTDDQFKRIWSQIELYKPKFYQKNLVKLDSKFNLLLKEKWSSFSLPINLDVNKTKEIFGNSKIYEFDNLNGYQLCNRINIGKGYLINTSKLIDVSIFDEIKDINSLLINIKIGWNLVGSLYKKCKVIESNIEIVYELIENEYKECNTLTFEPGKAYLIKSLSEKLKLVTI